MSLNGPRALGWCDGDAIAVQPLPGPPPIGSVGTAAARELPAPPCWDARLRLSIERVGHRSVAVERQHEGPLRVQKPLYPEGPSPVQIVIVHPPGGIAGGDRLFVDASIGDRAAAQLTTPGATRWYRSAGREAAQTVRLAAGSNSLAEWFPQESIVFDGALARSSLDVRLEADAVFFGWDVVCLGRIAAGERFVSGRWRSDMALHRGSRLLWTERAVLEGNAAPLHSRVCLGGMPVYGTFVAAAMSIDDAALAAVRRIRAPDGDAAVTRLPGVLLARYCGLSTASAKHYFVDMWRALRPRLCARDAMVPRVWST